jgi:hypothetical protein
LPPEPDIHERLRVMRRHLDLMIQVFGENHGCRMFRKVGPWYARRFGPASAFNKRIVTLSTRAGFEEIVEHYLDWRRQFLDGDGNLKASYRPSPLIASFMQDPSVASRCQIPLPKGPIDTW